MRTRYLKIITLFALLCLGISTVFAQSPLDVKVNFQKVNDNLPDGYLKDFGQPYGLRTDADQGNGAYTYGWVAESDLTTPLDLVGNGRDRDETSDQVLDTLMHMQYNDAPGNNGIKTAGAWAISVPNALYDVTVVLGDADNENVGSTNHVANVNDTPLIEFPLADFDNLPIGDPGRHTTATLSNLEVTDGRIVIDAIGGSNSKINAVEIVEVGEIAPTLVFDPTSATINLLQDVTATRDVVLKTNIDSTAYTLDTNNLPAWLEVNASDSTTDNVGVTVSLAIDTNGLQAGTYNYTLNAQATDYAPAALPITLNVNVQQSPQVLIVVPENGASNVPVNASVSATDLSLPNGVGIDENTLDANSVYLYPGNASTDKVAANLNSTGGGDAVTLTPQSDLEPNTSYTFVVTSALQDATGASFVGFQSTFTTGDIIDNPDIPVEFEQVSVASGEKYTTLVIGPDDKLYGLVNNGEIHRWVINVDGTLADKEIINSLQNAEGGDRLAIGLEFDPSATSGNLIAWVTHTTFGFGGQQDWQGKLTQLSGANLQNVQDYLVNLPRSAKDHVSNGIDFGPDGALYFNQGSNNAMGAPDSAWSFREERQLSAATLRVDIAGVVSAVGGVGNLPLDVKTEDDGVPGSGVYDAFAPGAPVTVYGSGVRNAYDLVWHSNGFLYVPTNGSAGGGNTPAYDSNEPSCALRVDGQPYNGQTDVPGVSPSTQNDYLFRVVEGGYYGHPNPTRCEWVINGGNPTDGQDPGEKSNKYPVGVDPDPNWRGFAYDFTNNKSPNGVIEYRSNTFNGALQGWLLVVRYSANDDILALLPGGENQDIVESVDSIIGFDGFSNPLDLTENLANGHIYVAEYGSSEITLLRPVGSDVVPQSVANVDEVIFDGVNSGTYPPTLTPLTLTNTGTGPLEITALTVGGEDTQGFNVVSPTDFPITLQPTETLAVDLTFTPGSTVGTFAGELTIESNVPTQTIGLYGLSTKGLEGGNEPPFQDAMDVLGFGIDVGWTSLGNTTSATLQGEEVDVSLFQKAGSGPVEILPVARYSPDFVLPFGYYDPNDGTPILNEVGVLSGEGVEHQALYPELASGGTTFDPGNSAFGLFTTSPSHTAYTQDAFNAQFHPNKAEHAVRTYPAKDRSGQLIPNAYIVAFEEASNGDYQDYVFLLTNVQPAVDSNDDVAPAAPTGLTADAGNGSVNLAWDANTETDLGGYALYRGTSSPVDVAGSPLATVDSTTTSYTDATVSNGTLYYYVLVALDTSNNASNPSAEASATPEGVPFTGGLLYREVFPNSNTGSNQDITTTGWTIEFLGNASVVTSNGTGAPTNLNNVVNGSEIALSATEQATGFAAGFNGTNNYFATTDEMTINRELYEITEIRWYQGHNNGQAMSYPVVQIGGQWYAANTGFTNSAIGNGGNFSSQAVQSIFTFDTAASNWSLFDADALAVGNALANPLPSGDVTAFGLYTQTGSSFTLRFDTYEIYAEPIDGNSPPQIVLTDNVAGTITVEEGGSADLPFTVTDPQDNLQQVSLDGPDFATLDDLGDGNYSLTISPQAEDSNNSPYTLTVTAIDDESAESSISITVEVIVPADNCPPISPLSCENVAVSIPFELDWAADEDGIVDGTGVGTGFTMVDAPSSPLTTPSNPDVPGYEPALLSVDTDNGILTINSTPGIQFEGNNSLVNALGVGLQAPLDAPITLETTLTNVPSPGSNSFQQAGLWFGIDEDNYAKVVIISGQGSQSNSYTVQVGYEGSGDSNETYNNAAPIAAGSTVTLKMVIDPTNGTMTGYYSVDGGSEIEGATYTIDPVVFAGVDHDSNGLTQPINYAGLYTTNRNNANSLAFNFADFAISSESTGITTLNGTVLRQGRTNHSGEITVTVDGTEYVTTADAEGVFEVELDGTFAGSYEVIVKAPNTLANGQDVTLPQLAPFTDFGTLAAGDANDDNVVSSLDFSLLAATFNLEDSDEGYNAAADFNGDSIVSSLDFSLLASNFNETGYTP